VLFAFESYLTGILTSLDSSRSSGRVPWGFRLLCLVFGVGFGGVMFCFVL